MIKFILNDQVVETNVLPTTVLLDFIRKEKKLTATKEGCREGDCGACTVLVGELSSGKVKYKSVNSCLMPIGDAHAKHVVTAEGINNKLLTPVQEGMVEEGGSQCGFCTPGFVVSMTGYFLNHEKFDLDEAVDSVGGNICRCTGYAGIKRAFEKANMAFSENGTKDQTHLEKLAAKNFVPSYFKGIQKKLKLISSQTARPKTKIIISGGTDLYVQKWEELVRSEANLVSADKKLHGIAKTKNKIKIGAATTVEEIKNSELLNKTFPGWRNSLELFGSMPIRNRATVGGNIVNASPIADTVNILMALDASVILKQGNKKRAVALRKFYKGYKILNKKENEIIETVSFSIPPKNFLFNFEKVSKRTYLDIASVNSSIYLEMVKGKISAVRISAGGVAPVPFFLAKTCRYLKSKLISVEVVVQAASISQSEISPISDARGSAEYKRLLLRQLIYAHFIKFFPELTNSLLPALVWEKMN